MKPLTDHFVPCNILISNGDEDGDVEHRGDQQGEDSPTHVHDDGHVADGPLPTDPPGVGQHPSHPPDTQVDDDYLAGWDAPSLEHPVVCERVEHSTVPDRAGSQKSMMLIPPPWVPLPPPLLKSELDTLNDNEEDIHDNWPVHSYKKDVQDDAHLKDEGQVLNMP